MKYFLYRMCRLLLPFLSVQLAVAFGVTLYLGELTAPALWETAIYVGFACCVLAALLLRGAQSDAGLLRHPTLMESGGESQRIWRGLLADLGDGLLFALSLMASGALLAGSAYLLKSP